MAQEAGPATQPVRTDVLVEQDVMRACMGCAGHVALHPSGRLGCARTPKYDACPLLGAMADIQAKGADTVKLGAKYSTVWVEANTPQFDDTGKLITK